MNAGRRALVERWALAATAYAATGPFKAARAGERTDAEPRAALVEPLGKAPAHLREVAPGVYFAQGGRGDATAENLGRIGNAGFVVGPDGVIGIDTGTSYSQGEALLHAIARITDRPVRAAVITQTRQEFLFGAAAYQVRRIPVWMQQQAAGLMRSRCEHCLENLRELLGDATMANSSVVKPEVEFQQTQTLGSTGRPLELLTFGHSSGPGATAVLDANSGVLFAGGLVDFKRVPDVQDADMDGWLQALDQLQQIPIKQIVPGHGGQAPVSAIQDTRRYLNALRARILELLREGAALSEVPNAAALPAFADWDQYDSVHRRNASILFVRYERDYLFTEPINSPRPGDR